MDPLIQFELNRAQAAIQRTLGDIQRARTLAELSRAQHVSLPSVLRGMRHALPGYRQLGAAADKRAHQLFSEALAQVRADEVRGVPLARLLEALARLENEWRRSAGDFAQPRALALRELVQIRARLTALPSM